MKKVNKLLMLSLSLMSTLIVSCNNNDLSQSSNNTTNTTTNTQTTTTSNGDVGYDDDFSYYLETKINDKKELKVFRNFQVGESKALNKNELVIATAIQGFFSRENGKYYCSRCIKPYRSQSFAGFAVGAAVFHQCAACLDDYCRIGACVYHSIFGFWRKTGAEDLDRSQPFLYRIGRSVFRVCVRDGRRKNLWKAGDRSFTAN